MRSDVLLDAVARARHDLGKYVAFQVRSLDPTASDADLRSALDADLNHTRSTPDADCAQVWAELRGPLAAAGLSGEDLYPMDAAVIQLRGRALALDHLSTGILWETVTLAITLGDQLRALHRALLAEAQAADRESQ